MRERCAVGGEGGEGLVGLVPKCVQRSIYDAYTYTEYTEDKKNK